MRKSCSICGGVRRVTRFKNGMVCEKCLTYIKQTAGGGGTVVQGPSADSRTDIGGRSAVVSDAARSGKMSAS
jgi:reverse gyrase